MSNGLRDMVYGGTTQTQQWTLPQNQGGSLVGADFGFNVGNQTVRVQLAIAGLFVGALAVLLLMHRAGHRFSVHVE